MMFLLGRQAMLGQEPPRYLRSIVATRCPFCANVHARNFDPVPLPSITRSYSSAFVILVLGFEEVSTLLISLSFPPAMSPARRTMQRQRSPHVVHSRLQRWLWFIARDVTRLP